MNKHILVGVDATFSRATQHALRTFSELIEYAPPSLDIILLHVIPMAYMTSPSMGLYMGQFQSVPATPEQCAAAEDVLLRASAELLNQGICSRQVERLVRQGVPADEIVKVAREMRVDLI